MAAGLEAGGDHGVDAALLEPHRLGHGGGAGDDLGPGRLDPLQQCSARQAEVEADHLGPDLLDHRAEGLVERRPSAGGRRRAGIDAFLHVIGRERRPPAHHPRRVGGRRDMAEEVEVDRPLAARPHQGHGVPRLVGRDGGAGDRAQAARLADRQGHLRRRGIGHRRLDDREVDAEQVEDPAVGPAAICAHLSSLLELLALGVRSSGSPRLAC